MQPPRRDNDPRNVSTNVLFMTQFEATSTGEHVYTGFKEARASFDLNLLRTHRCVSYNVFAPCGIYIWVAQPKIKFTLFSSGASR